MSLKICNYKNFSYNIITEEYTLKKALELLNKLEIKVLFIVSGVGFVATLTDGDMRRAILAEASLEDKVSKFANYSPIYLEEDNLEYAEKNILDKAIDALPILEKNRHIVKVYVNVNKLHDKVGAHVNMPIVIMAGGKGTRLFPYTKILPKPLIPIADIPISERIIRLFEDIGCDKFHMIVNYKKEMIKSYFMEEKKQYDISFWEETVPQGTGGGIYLLKDAIQETFILTNCDIIIMEDISKIVEHHKKEHNSVTMVCSHKKFEIPYGVVKFSNGGEISSFEEKPSLSFFTNTGYYVLEPNIFKYVNKDENISMPNIIERMKNQGEKIGIYPIAEEAWFDMGQIDTMESMEHRFSELNI